MGWMAKDEMVRAGTRERGTAGEENTDDPRPPRGS
jgi:hypothetical protein